MKGRIINFRSFFVVAVSVMIAILGVRLFFQSRPLGFLVLFLLVGILFGFAVFYARRNTPIYQRATFLVAIVLSAIAAVNFYLSIQTATYADESVVHLVSGKADTIDVASGCIVIQDIIIDGDSERGKIQLSVDFESYPELYALKVGDILIFETILKPNPVLMEGKPLNAYAFRSGIRYQCYSFLSESETVVLEKSNPDVFQKIRTEVYDMLVLAMGSEHGGVAYGMFSGDTNFISEELGSAYNISGMAHTLSVSGLHISYLCAAILGVLRLLRVKRLPANLVTIAILWVYMLFTGFVPAAFRAVIMATIMLSARLLKRRYDPLNSLCAAVAVILVIFPIYLYDIGFQLSVTAVFGIILFSKPIANTLIQIRFSKYIAQTIGVTLSAQIGFLPALIFGFQNIQVYALFLNVLLLPIIGVLFSVMLLGILLMALFRPFLFILRFVGLGMSLVDTVILSAAKLPISVLYVLPTLGATIFACYLLLFYTSRFSLRPKGRWKRIHAGVAFALSAILCFSGIFTTPKFENETYLAPVDSYGDVTSIVCHDGKTYVVGDFTNFYAIDQTLIALHIRRVDAIFLSALSSETARNVVLFSYQYRAGKIFVYEGGDLSGIDILVDNAITNFYTFDGNTALASNMMPIVEGGKHYAYELLTEQGSMLLCGYRANYSRIPLAVIDRVFAIRCFMYQDYYSDRIFITNMERGYKGMDSPDYQFTLQNEQRFVFDFSIGELYRFPA